eukprot:3674147-Pleurochrysis_carterae.AAC.2
MKSQNPNDFGLPVSQSMVRFHLTTFPQQLSRSTSIGSSKVAGIFPTYAVHTLSTGARGPAGGIGVARTPGLTPGGGGGVGGGSGRVPGAPGGVGGMPGDAAGLGCAGWPPGGAEIAFAPCGCMCGGMRGGPGGNLGGGMPYMPGGGGIWGICG